MTKEEAKKIIFNQWQSFLEHNIDYGGISEAYKMAIKALEQQPCEDCISREAVIEVLDKYIEKAQSTGTKDDFISFQELVVKQLPSVTPHPKMGRWEYVQYDNNPNIGNWHCSECRGICTEMHSIEDAYNYCPNCGAKMEVEE